MACVQMFPCKILIRAYCQSGCRRPSSVNRSCSQMASFAASVKTMYLAFVDERATIGCLFDYQLTKPPLSIKIKLKFDFQLSLSCTQSELEYLFTNSLFQSPQMIFCLFEPFKYCKIVFTALVYQWSVFFTKRLVIEVAKTISSFISTIENMRDFVILQQRFFFKQ